MAAAVGVPPITPVAEFSERPAGNAPEVTCQLRAPSPPLAASVSEYAVPVEPPGSESVVMVNFGAMVNVRLAAALCCGVLVSVTLKPSGVAVTATVGVPLS